MDVLIKSTALVPLNQLPHEVRSNDATKVHQNDTTLEEFEHHETIRLQEEVEKLKRGDEEKEERILQLSQHLDNARTLIRSLKNQKRENEIKVQDRRVQSERSHNDTLAQLTAHYNDLDANTEQLRRTNETLRGEVSKLKDEATQQRAHLQGKMDEQEADAAQLRRTNETLRGEVSKLKDEATQGVRVIQAKRPKRGEGRNHPQRPSSQRQSKLASHVQQKQRPPVSANPHEQDTDSFHGKSVMVKDSSAARADLKGKTGVAFEKKTGKMKRSPWVEVIITDENGQEASYNFQKTYLTVLS